MKESSLRSLKDSLLMFMIAIVFGYTLIDVFVNHLTQHAYLGYGTQSNDPSLLVCSFVLIGITILHLPKKILKVSDFILILLFWLAYMPIMVIAPKQEFDFSEIMQILFSIFMSFNLMIYISNLKIFKLNFSIDRSIYELLRNAFFLLYILLNLYIIFIYRSSFNLAGYEEIYTQRELVGTAITEKNIIVNYTGCFLQWAFNPFLIALGLTEKKISLVFMGTIGEILIYATLANKGVLLSPLFILAFYYFVIADKNKNKSLKTASVIISLMLITYLLYLYNLNYFTYEFFFLIFVRVFGIVPAMFASYIHFFNANSFTYYSHINIVSKFIQYPYEKSLGEEVGFFLVGDGHLDANAGFWASDGYGGLGYLGIVIIGIVIGFIFILFNSICQKKLKLSCTAFIPFTMLLCNGSLFTSLLTGGGLLVLIFIFFSSCEVRETFKRRTPNSIILET